MERLALHMKWTRWLHN